MASEFDGLIDGALALPISGWDPSLIKDRWKTGSPPWSYRTLVLRRLASAATLLDLGTGGGELLSTLGPLPRSTYATEGYPPNLLLARRRLDPLGVRVLPIGPDNRIDLPSASIELAVSRHEEFDPDEVYRVLRPGGTFITQQVGRRNYREINERLKVASAPATNAVESAGALAKEVASAGLRVQDQRDTEYDESFLDVGALVWYLRFAPWQVPGFAVLRFRRDLERIHEDIGRTDGFKVSAHRMLVIADRPP